MAFSKVNRRAKIKRRIRKKITGTSAMPRLSVFRSNKQMCAQIIDDSTGKTLVSATSYKSKTASK
jgi:large subunit ribosomal protein L18